MRRFVITVVALAVTLAGAAACATTPSANPHATATASTATTAATGSDETEAVCDEAISVSTSSMNTLKSKLAEGQTAFLAGDTAKALSIQASAKTTATEWTNKLTELSKKQIKPEVKTVLTDGVTTINGLMNSTTTSPTDAEKKLNDFMTKLKAACA
jgi:hypothetical protein